MSQISTIGSGAALGSITMNAGPGIAIVGSPVSLGGAVTISATGSGFIWSLIGANQTLAVENGYICTAGGTLALSLPAASAVGDEIIVTLDGSTGWQITQAAGQQIRIANAQSTLGAGGSLASTAQGDTIHMVCSVANTRWNVIDIVGNITVV